jgi:outer membrane protein OmpA-like peptidoglycan-associated protein
MKSSFSLNSKDELMKHIALVLACALGVFALASCESQQVKKDMVEKSAPVDQAALEAANKKLAALDFAGFNYKDSSVSSAAFKTWSAKNLNTIQAIAASLPPMLVIQVTGHADTKGPELAEGSKPGNVQISSDRAANFRKSLVDNGVPADKLSSKGIGTAETLKGVAGTSAKQRRVSFKVVPR